MNSTLLQIFLLGAVEGLFSVHIKTQNEQMKHDLVPIIGPKLVKDFVFLSKLQLVLMIAGMFRKNILRFIIFSYLILSVLIFHRYY